MEQDGEIQVRWKSDLISRQAALNELSHANWGKEWDEALAKAIIESVPTIDPVKHGKWMEKKVTHEDNRRSTIIADWQSAKCSNCGRYHTTPYLYYFDHYNYCPNCGAKVEG